MGWDFKMKLRSICQLVMFSIISQLGYAVESVVDVAELEDFTVQEPHAINDSFRHHPSIQTEQNLSYPSLPIDLIESLLNQAKQKKLSEHVVWKRLFYVEHAQSRVTHAPFFLTKQGKDHLDQELEHHIQALFDKSEENQSVRCRFPARSAWLIQQLNIPQHTLPDVKCTEFDQWYEQIKPHKMTLIFATDYMGSPGSMFGHTLLRFDPADKPANGSMDLVSYALNYAAFVPPKDNSFVYAWNGLTGRYLGEYSLMKYFHKVKEYGDLESRDIWEYELDFTPEEVKFLVQHIWEMKHVKFPYYFIDENCSYALLGLTDLIRPTLNLQSNFKWSAIPVETVKALKKQGLIKKTVYRPALETQLLHQEKQYGSTLAKTAHQLTLQKTKPVDLLVNYSIQNQARLLEMAYDDLYLQHIARRVEPKFAQSRLRELLTLRSQLAVSKQRQDVPRPNYDSTQGHGAKMWSIQMGQVQGDQFLELGGRMAYHSLSDPTQGYAEGMQLLFLNGQVQLRENRIKLSDLDLLSVHTLNPITSFRKPLSWGFDLAWKQQSVDSTGQFSTNQQHGVATTSTQFGYSKAVANHRGLCSLQAKAELQAGKILDDGWRIGIAPTAFCTAQWTDHLQQSFKVETPYWYDVNQWQIKATHELQYSWNQHHALRFNWHYEQQNSKKWDKISLGYHLYH